MSVEVRLGSVLESPPKNGYSPKDVPEWTGLKALGLGCLTPRGFAPSQLKNVPDSATARRFTLVNGDLLMSRANTRELVGLVGRFTDIGTACIYPDLMMRLRPQADRCLPRYLEIVLRSSDVRREIQAGARGTSESMVKISASLVENLRIPLPPLPEQRDIVAANEAFERRIGALERELAKLRTVEDAVVAGTMAEAGGRIELGRWLSSIEAGKSPMAEDTPAGDGEWGVLKVSAVQPGWFKATENKVIREAEFINARYAVSTGDLLMTRANTEELVGLACVVRERAERLMLSDKTLRLVPDTSVADAEFIELALLSPSVRSQVRSRATGTSASMKNIGQSAVRQLMVPDVPKDVQRKAVAAVSASRKRSQGVQRQIAKLRTIQQGVIEDLLSGRSRVNRT
ncbi:restriction endonuclease subunit S [Streptomyces sp. NRRL S-31]|uniref:restriction endonuclease subunit S n=1 Tax=Streptomyces sp. NRRL S-31 TaxID=1463898 RepID=UPI0004CAA69D|nr:restriction endonuclease subunit S [Streptomyces sp. NRRL S-31]